MKQKFSEFAAKTKVASEKFIDKFAECVVKKRIWFTAVFAALLIAFGICFVFVNTNYDSTVYLPDTSEVKKGLSTMYSEFGDNGNASVMITNEKEGGRLPMKYADAVAFKEELAQIKGISDIMWLDDLFDGITGTLSDAYTKNQYAETILVMVNVISKTDLSAFENLNSGMEINENNIDGLVSGVLYIIKSPISAELNTGNYDIDYDTLSSVINSMAKELLVGDAFSEVDISSLDVEEINTTIAAFKTSLDMFYSADEDGNNCALYQVAFSGTDYAKSTINAIDEIRSKSKNEGYGIFMSGNAATTYNSIDCVSKQTLYALIAVVIVVLLVLYLFSTSYWEPILYLAAIGIAVVINMGSNIFMNSVSYLTSGVAGILQLALSMDYSIFLMTRFKQEKEKTPDVEEAMKNAIKASLRPISASSLTTIASFIAIMFMSYTIGLDMGIVFAKGVILSLCSVFMLLPGLAIYTNKWIEKSKHKSFKLTLYKYTDVLLKCKKVVPIVILAVIVAGFIGQNYISFGYGDTATFGSKGSLIYEDKTQIEGVFGRQNQLAILLNKDKGNRTITLEDGTVSTVEEEITKELAACDFVTTAQSLSVIKKSGMDAILPSAFLSQFDKGGDFTRLITYIDLDEEGEKTEKAINTVREILQKYDVNKGEYYLLGGSSSAIEIKEIVNVDYMVITWVSIGLVALILFITFRNFILPILLVISIQGSVWISMSINALTGNSLVFLGYLIVSAVMLGATIDYGILLTSNYCEARKTQNKNEAIKTAIAKSSRAILTSSIILCCVGYSIGLTSSMPAITVFGQLVGRTALASLVLVFAFLPTLLVLFDKLIAKTTIGGCSFIFEEKMVATETAPEKVTEENSAEQIDDEAAATKTEGLIIDDTKEEDDK